MKRVIVMPGEGIGPEVIGEAVTILRTASQLTGASLRIEEFTVGEAAYQAEGRYLPASAERACDEARERGDGAMLFGAVADQPIALLRERYDLFANIRPIRGRSSLVSASPMKPERVAGVDVVIVRELVSGIYYGAATSGVHSDRRGRWFAQQMYYDEQQVRRIVRVALRWADGRRKKLTLAHKINAIPGVFSLWHEILEEERASFPAVECDAMLVDNLAMQMVLSAQSFDVILAPNMFGDILSDVGAAVVGSIGLLPSISANERGFALYEPVAGTAPTLAGRNCANPVAAILSAALMCRHSLGMEAEATLIEQAVDAALTTHRTIDIAQEPLPTLTTSEMGAVINDQLLELARNR